MINPQRWAALKQSIQKQYKIPDFFEKVSNQPLNVLEMANVLSAETKLLELSYLEFLDEQILLEPRGKDWTKVLRNRKERLLPYVGKELTTLTFALPGGTVVITYCEKDASLIMFELQ